MANNAILTKDNLIKRKQIGNPTCQFYYKNETIDHLFFTCPITKVIWIVIAKCIVADNIPTSLPQCWNWCDKWLPTRKKFYLWGISAICWAIWKARNNAFFEKKND